MPIARQDASSWCRRLKSPLTPPRATTDPEDQGAFAVATFAVGAQIFWINDRLSFPEEHLDRLGLKSRGCARLQNLETLAPTKNR